MSSMTIGQQTRMFIKYGLTSTTYNAWFFWDKKDNYISQMRQYTEKGLPADVRKQVRSIYYDYAIKYVKEVNAKDVTAYFITLEDPTSWKEIRVINSKLNVWKEDNKEK